MTRNLSVILQSIAIVGQFVVPTLPLNPDQTRMVHAIIAAAQAILALIAHSHNPDGTTCKVAYIPEANQ